MKNSTRLKKKTIHYDGESYPVLVDEKIAHRLPRENTIKCEAFKQYICHNADVKKMRIAMLAFDKTHRKIYVRPDGAERALAQAKRWCYKFKADFFVWPIGKSMKSAKKLITTPTGPTPSIAYDDYGEDSEFIEGKIAEKIHKSRERNPAVIRKAKDLFKQKEGRLYCQVCEFDFYDRYGEIGRDFIEGHHTGIPISESKGEMKTKVKDIALVCSNCHRMLHRRRPWLKMGKLKRLLRKK
ncbi:MAG: hypothetical protein IEMM0002_1211 [bacterium]|nr:MAG: hypothetical protein IEMM0002_1211 [bacterium]